MGSLSLRRAFMKFNDAITGVLLLLLALAVLVNVSSFPDIPGQNIGPAAFPGVLAVLLAGCGLLLIWQGLRSAQRQSWIELGAWTRSRLHVRNFLITIGCLVFYTVASDELGFLITGFAILCAMFWALDVRARLIVPVALVVTLVVHLVFYKGLRVPLPWGILLPLQW